MGKKSRLIFAAAILAYIVLAGFFLSSILRREHQRTKDRNEFIGRWNASCQRQNTEIRKLNALVKDLNDLEATSGEDPQKFKMAKVLAQASDEILSYAHTCFTKIPDQFDKAAYDLKNENDLLALTEKPIAYATELNKRLEQEIKDLKNAESPK